MKVKEMNKMKDMVLVKLNYQMVTHTKDIIKMVNAMVKEHISEF